MSARHVFLEAVGVYSENVAAYADLSAIVGGPAPRVRATHAADVSSLPVRVRPKRLDTIDREDRAMLNEVSGMVINAIDDAIESLQRNRLTDYANAPVFSSSDGPEHTFAALGSLLRDESDEDIYHRLGRLRDRVNPLDMLRSLTTNATYHASKRLGTHGGAYPVRAASLGGLVALDEALAYLDRDEDAAACVFAAGNMQRFDSLAIFTKLGVDKASVSLSYGAACLLLRRASHVDAPLAKIMSAHTRYAPTAHAMYRTWRDLLMPFEQDGDNPPDTIVTYGIGASVSDNAEQAAINDVFPGVPVRNYKSTFGYTGAANNLLDLAAVLADSAVKTNTAVLLLGSGLTYGVGAVLFEKL